MTCAAVLDNGEWVMVRNDARKIKSSTCTYSYISSIPVVYSRNCAAGINLKSLFTCWPLLWCPLSTVCPCMCRVCAVIRPVDHNLFKFFEYLYQYFAYMKGFAVRCEDIVDNGNWKTKNGYAECSNEGRVELKKFSETDADVSALLGVSIWENNKRNHIRIGSYR